MESAHINEIALLGFARYCKASGQQLEAVDAYKTCIIKSTDNDRASHQLSTQYFDIDLFDEAKKDFLSPNLNIKMIQADISIFLIKFRYIHQRKTIQEVIAKLINVGTYTINS